MINNYKTESTRQKMAQALNVISRGKYFQKTARENVKWKLWVLMILMPFSGMILLSIGLTVRVDLRASIKTADTNEIPSAQQKQYLPATTISTTETTSIKHTKRTTIGYATSIAFCPSGKANTANIHGVTEGPSILAHSIARSHEHSKYDYKLYAIVHPSSLDCVKEHLNDYTILERDSPVNPKDVQSKEYARLIKFGSGCCGAREFLKLYVYTLQEDIVVHLDYDIIMLQPMDELYDAMLSQDASSHTSIQRPRNDTIPNRVDVFFTRDYIQNNPLAVDQPLKYAFQGGFFMVRPNISLFEEMIDIIQRGNYNDKTGWENSRIGGFYGAAQIQGFMAYIYSDLHPEHAVEVNRCIYNNLIYDEPRNHRGKCWTGEETCEDCRITPLEDMKLAHFAACPDPWYCELPSASPERCRDVLTEWFRVRQSLDKDLGYSVPHYHDDDWTLGYCRNGTYSPISRHG